MYIRYLCCGCKTIDDTLPTLLIFDVTLSMEKIWTIWEHVLETNAGKQLS
jgi:hypothetical protein